MAATVWMRHPTLPPEQLIEVPERAVPHHQAAGWEIAEPPAPKPKLPPAHVPTRDGAAPAGALEGAPLEDPAPDEAAATRPRRTRRASTEAEES
ncbi:hypothetical protein [Streptomyces sp. Amel2xC10]|uniref:hypothetical protein n=1 Tax=Streptomyces sp. Amel2xC10 TaxID=1305826 RepID=UPI000A084C87|nr:hypothetical protein [Streptomyces sp. Amel2xC10]SMF86126.1 hypothetical protein SAMN02745830_07130 [Streptomyces sp. Amel2xC10]